MDATTMRPAAVEPIQPFKDVVVPVGGSDREFLAQQHAVELAAALGVRLRAIHVASAIEEVDEQEMFQYIRKACEDLGVQCECDVILGEAAEELLQELDSLDLVVLGTGRLGTRYHLSSIAERVIKEAPCMVQVVRLDP